MRALHPELRESLPISGNLGPRGDGYQVGTVMTPEEARVYFDHDGGEAERDLDGGVVTLARRLGRPGDARDAAGGAERQ